MRRGSRRTRGQTDAWHGCLAIVSRLRIRRSVPKVRRRDYATFSRRLLAAIWWRHLYICHRYWRESTPCCASLSLFLFLARVFIYYASPLLRTSRAQVLGSLYESWTTTCLSWPAFLPDRELEKGTTIPPRFKGGSFRKSWESVVLRARVRRRYRLWFTADVPWKFSCNSEIQDATPPPGFTAGGLFRSGLGGITDGSPVQIY